MFKAERTENDLAVNEMLAFDDALRRVREERRLYVATCDVGICQRLFDRAARDRVQPICERPGEIISEVYIIGVGMTRFGRYLDDQALVLSSKSQ